VQGDAALLEDETFRTLVLWSLVPAALGVMLLAVAARDVPSQRHVRHVGDMGRPSAPASTGVRDASRLRSTSETSGFGELGSGFRWFLLASVLFELGNSADALIVLRAQERGLSVAGVLWILLAFNVVYAAVAAPAGAVSDRLGRRGTVFVGWMVYCVAYLGFAFAESTWHMAILYLVYGVYHGVVAGAAKALVVGLVPPGLRGTAFGMYAAVVGVVSLPASLLGGILWGGFGAWPGLGPAAPFAFGAVTAAVAAAVLLSSVPERTWAE
jgi:MFS family permease